MRRLAYRTRLNNSESSFRVALFFLFFVLFVSACVAQKTVPPLVAERGILWKIEKENVAPSYVFGTVHAEDPRVLKVVDDIKPIVDQTKKLMLEVPLDRGSSQEAMSAMLYGEGKSLKDAIGGKRFDQVMSILQKRGFPSMLISRMKPWAVFTILNMPENETGVFLDAQLYQNAMNSGKAFEALETIEEQTSLFDKLPLKLQLILLDDTLKNLGAIEKDLDRAIDAYLSRDLDQIVKLQDDLLKRSHPELHDFFTQQLIIKRNRLMVTRMSASLETGGVFIAVGALHLPGKFGILNLINEKGYVLTPVY